MNRQKPYLTLSATGILLMWMFVMPFQTCGQTITGTIKDSETGKALDFATIYISGTTHGTLSDGNGNFSLRLRDVVLPCQLVFSHVSYLNKVIPVSGQADVNLLVRLSPKVVEIHQVSVVEKGFRKYNVRHFKNIFLGTDSWGRDAELKNDSVLIFETEYFEGDTMEQRRTGKGKSFDVRAIAPLQIDLPSLGYDLQVDLIRFTEKYRPESNNYLIRLLGYFYYKPKETKTKYREKRYESSRQKAYFFSPMHFTRSLFENKLAENGYQVYFYQDSAKNMKFKKHFFNSGSWMTFSADSAVVSGLKDQCFYVNYSCDFDGFPIPPGTGRHTDIKWSAICFLNDTCIIRKDGTRPGNSVFFGPGLGDKRIGAMLPGNYQPLINK